MSELLEQLRKAVGETNVLEGEAVHADYTHDETLTVTPVRPLVLVLPGSTSEVAEVLRLAGEHEVPVVARGSGTGLSGAAVPVADGILLAFDRMNRIVEIDVENQVAVVEPGVTLEQLNGELAPLGLIYPVSPGEQSASLGGNVGTNAGGMRAVRYGVTRHHVLGLEVVLADGTVLRTGGKFVKCSTGYDLTQLLIGSEGTLAVTTEVTVKVHPRLTETATVLAPFGTLAEVTHAVPRIVASGIDPTILEYADALVLGSMTGAAGLDLGIPDEVKEAAQAYLIVVLEQSSADRLDEDVERLGTLLTDLGAVEVYVLPPHAGADLITARETALLRDQGRRARTTSSTPSSRGPPSPTTWPGWTSWRPSTAPSSRAAGTWATATCTWPCSNPTWSSARRSPGRSSGRRRPPEVRYRASTGWAPRRCPTSSSWRTRRRSS